MVGRGISLPLQVFKTVGRGWGVRSRNPIRAGTFVCEYTGVMLRDEDAEAAGLEVGSSELLVHCALLIHYQPLTADSLPATHC